MKHMGKGRITHMRKEQKNTNSGKEDTRQLKMRSIGERDERLEVLGGRREQTVVDVLRSNPITIGHSGKLTEDGCV